MQGSSTLRQLVSSQDQLEALIDQFEREEFMAGDIVISKGEDIRKLYIVKMGDLVCSIDGKPLMGNSYIQETGGFTYWGDKVVKVRRVMSVSKQ